MSAFRLGPLGALREIPPLVQRGTSVTPDRPSSEWRTLGGVRVAQRAPRALRTWPLDLGQWRSPEQVAYLTALATGAIPGPLYLYTEWAARTNLLPADVAAPGQMGISGMRRLDGSQPARKRVPALLGGVLTPVVGVNCAPSDLGAWSPVLPLPLGSYRLSGWATSAGSVVTWQTIDASETQVATGTITAASSSGSFRGESTVTLSGAAVGLRLRLPTNASPTRYVGALRLTAGATAQTADWLPGEGVPAVMIDDPQAVLQLATTARLAADYTVTIRELS